MINNFINNIKIKTKLFASYISISIITLLIITVYLSPRITNYIIDSAVKETKQYNNTIKDRLEQVLELAISISDIIYYEEKLNSSVITKDESNLEIFKGYEDYQMLEKYLIFNEEIKSIRLYIDNSNTLSNSYIIKVNDEIKNNQWYGKAIRDKGLITWYYKKDEITGIYSLSLVREIRTSERGHIGVLVINIANKSFNNIIANESYNSTILLDGIVVYSDKLEIGSKINYLQDQNNNTLYKENNQEYREGNKYKILNDFKINKSYNNTFQILGEVSLDKITKEPMKIINTTIISTLIVIIISLIISIFFLKKFYERIDSLRKGMHKFVNGEFNVLQNIDGNDEIGEIYSDLQIMINSINELIDDVYIKGIQQEQLIAKQKEIEFKMLCSQINPHFLYNTLETIRMRAFCSGDKELATIVKKLGKLMRRNLEVTNEIVSLVSEIEAIKDYLDIQGLRFTGKIEYEINSKVDINKYKIMPLLLQPIIENSIVHGIESLKGKGKLDINIYEKLEFLIVDISDNGCGIEAKKLKDINEKLANINNELEKVATIDKNENKRKGIGISNINERIKIFYGQQYGVRIFSEQNIGTKVLIILPAIREGK